MTCSLCERIGCGQEAGKSNIRCCCLPMASSVSWRWCGRSYPEPTRPISAYSYKVNQISTWTVERETLIYVVYMPLISTVGEQTQVGPCEFKASVVCIASPWPVVTIQWPHLDSNNDDINSHHRMGGSFCFEELVLTEIEEISCVYPQLPFLMLIFPLFRQKFVLMSFFFHLRTVFSVFIC